MTSEKQAELTRIVATRRCGHIAAFATVEDLLRGKDACPLCAASRRTIKRTPDQEPAPRERED